MTKKRVLSGNRPTGKLHLGHLHGALANWVKLQDEYECFFFVADWHALTTEYQSPKAISGHILEMVVDWLAAGLDPERSTIFVQSHVPQHAELFVLLSMITPLGWLERNPTYKDQQQELKEKDLSTFGFLGYPVLQTADIILYKAHGVPVGVDQVPHIEIAREIARRFNFLYRPEENPLFPEPQPLLTKVPKVPGVDGRKMSKSYGNAIDLGEPADSVEQKLKTMMTDPARKRRTDPGNPDICPVFDLHRIYSTDEERAWAAEGCRTAGIGCLDCKKVLIRHVQDELEPIRERRAELLAKPEVVRDVLRAGERRASAVAEATMAEVREVLGFSPGSI
ncbi:MAG: tryptophan--tRNA ligase [Candidatus Methylomirabilis sp.]|nr:tryptophan--tRNA ligase [Deltaproteobacteria bacterium]